MSDPSVTDLADYQAKDSQQALDDAVATVRAFCGWHIAPPLSETVTVHSTDGLSVFVETLRLTEVTTVTQDSIVIDPATYTFERYGVITRTAGYCFDRCTTVTLDVTHGYDDWPADVKSVVLSLAQRSIADTRGMVPRVGGAGASVVIMENYGSQLGEGDKDKLAPYTLAPGTA
jgi:hypothetical protein